MPNQLKKAIRGKPPGGLNRPLSASEEHYLRTWRDLDVRTLCRKWACVLAREHVGYCLISLNSPVCEIDPLVKCGRRLKSEQDAHIYCAEL